MKTIQLSQGKVAIVDDEDYDYLMQWKWHYCKGHASRVVSTGGNPRQRRIYMHRIINKTPEELETDHININGLDNRKSNLRNCTALENMRNKHVAGVDFSLGKWRARIKIKEKRLELGRFDNREDARQAYITASKHHFGEFSPFAMGG